MRVALYLLPVILAVYAFVDCVLDRPRPAPLAPRFVWFLAIVFIPIIGPITWLVTSKLLRQGPPPQRPAPRPAAPDDDPEFLRGLGRGPRGETPKKRSSE